VLDSSLKIPPLIILLSFSDYFKEEGFMAYQKEPRCSDCAHCQVESLERDEEIFCPRCHVEKIDEFAGEYGYRWPKQDESCPAFKRLEVESVTVYRGFAVTCAFKGHYDAVLENGPEGNVVSFTGKSLAEVMCRIDFYLFTEKRKSMLAKNTAKINISRQIAGSGARPKGQPAQTCI
jgi:hypothetical protein